MEKNNFFKISSFPRRPRSRAIITIISDYTEYNSRNSAIGIILYENKSPRLIYNNELAFIV